MDLMEAAYRNPIVFQREFLPHWFKSPTPWLFRGLAAIVLKRPQFLLDFGYEEWSSGEKFLWDEKGLDKILRHFSWTDANNEKHPLFELKGSRLIMTTGDRISVVFPRGIGKTTNINSLNLLRIVYSDCKFLVYISEAQPHADTQLNTIKRELEANEKLRSVFGNLVPARNSTLKWSEGEIHTTNSVYVVARGRSSQIRGLNINGVRPDAGLLDDVEDEESVQTESQRNKTFTWFKSAVEPAFAEVGVQGQLIAVGTLLHVDAMLARLERSPDWISMRFGAIDPDGEMLWNRYMSKTQYEAKRASYAQYGLVETFDFEYGSQASDALEHKKFRAEDILYRPRPRSDFIAVALACDPAIGTNKKSDFFVLAVVGVDAKGRLHVLDTWGGIGVSPSDQVAKFFELHFKWDCTHHGVEAIAYQRALISLINEGMFEQSKKFGAKAYFEVTPITHGQTAKETRVEGILSPRYRAKYITHERRFIELESQLLDWPLSKKDYPDAVAMAVGLLKDYVGLVLEETDDKGESKQSLDDAIGGEFRAAP